MRTDLELGKPLHCGGICINFMLLRASVRALDRLPFRSHFGTSQQYASCRGLFRTQLWRRPFKVALNSASLFQIRSPEDWPRVPLASLRMGWVCASCTFINKAGPTCGVCSEPAPGASTSYGDEKWTCEACTFVNTVETAFCEICDHGRPAMDHSSRGASTLATLFRPLRAMTRVEPRAEEGDAPVERLEAERVVDELRPRVDSGRTSPKSKKRKAKEAEVIDLSDSKSEENIPDFKKTKQNGEEPNDLLKQLHEERMARMRAGASEIKREKSSKSVPPGSSDVVKKKDAVKKDVEKDDETNVGVISLSSLSREQKLAYIEAEGTWLEKPTSELIVLSYNVWFREDLELQSRLEAIGDVILQHRPHIVFFQEVTEAIYQILQRSSWWKSYECSVKPGVASQRAYFCMQLSKLPVFSFRQSPFRNSVMGRELCLAEVDAGKGTRLLVATSHLESPCPAPPTWNQMFSPERVVQAKEAMALLKEFPNVIFGGDMNWDDKKDGPPPLPSGWFDAWLQLQPGKDGFTYDTKANLMLSGNRSLRKRLDRMFCQLRDFEAVSIEIVGTEAIPDLSYSKEKKVKGQVQTIKLPVLPSDHFGLLLKLSKKCVKL